MTSYTSQKKKILPVHVTIKGNGLIKKSIALTEQLTTISKADLQFLIGKLDDDTMQKIKATLHKPCAEDAPTDFFVRLYRNSAGILSYVKGFLCKMTENMSADSVQSRQAGFVRCCLNNSIRIQLGLA